MPTERSSHLSYLDDADTLRERVDRTVRLLEPHADRFDSIAVQGLSGVTVGSIVAYRMRKRLIIVRKDETKSHREVMVEGLPSPEPFRYIFLDDFTCTGDTRDRVLEAIQNADCSHGVDGTFVGEFYHLYGTFRPVPESVPESVPTPLPVRQLTWAPSSIRITSDDRGRQVRTADGRIGTVKWVSGAGDFPVHTWFPTPLDQDGPPQDTYLYKQDGRYIDQLERSRDIVEFV